MRDNVILAPWQERQVTAVLEDLITTADPKLLSELLSGYQDDFNDLIRDLRINVADSIFLGKRMESADLQSLASITTGIHNSMCVHSYNYFKTTMIPDFDVGWRNIEWGNLVQKHPFIAFLCSRGSGKCFAPGFNVLMFDGSIKKIENIKLGDQVMGPDNTVRTVIQLHEGYDDMYEVEVKNGTNYTVNSRHDLYFGKWSKNENDDEEKIKTQTLTPPEYLFKNQKFKDNCFQLRSNGWELPKQNLPIEPYYLGIWLGDGSARNTEIGNIDSEIIEYIKGYADRLKMFYSCQKKECQRKKVIHQIVGYKRGEKPKENYLIQQLKQLDVIQNKHIPELYLKSSKEQRFELLAGLCDTDGYNSKNKPYSFVFSQKNKRLIQDVQRLAWSLGFKANFVRHDYKSENVKSGETFIYVLHISGNLNNIPFKVGRRKNKNVNSKMKSTARCGFTVKHKGKGKYIGFAVDKDHLFLGQDCIIHNNSFEFCYAFLLWRLYTYSRPPRRELDTINNKNRKESLMITNERKLGRNHNEKIIAAIQNFDELKEKLNPNGKAKLGVDQVICENGAKLDIKSAMGFIRGRHVGAVAVDDFPDESSIYSKEQREKYKQIFYGAIKYVVEPYGHLVVSGTPFHVDDIYGTLRQDESFVVFEYPAIFPDGTLLAPDRYTFEDLMKKKKTDGNIIFSQEVLVSPITDASSLFPYEILRKSVESMENIKLVSNIESYPIKFQSVAIGCDFAISGSIAADYTVFSVWGLTSTHQYYLIDLWRKKGAQHNEQVAMIKSMDQRYHPNKIICESNNFQKILADLAKDAGVRTIEEFTTHKGNKRSMKEGLPSLAALFERDEIKIPYAPGKSREVADDLMSEFNSMGFDQDKGSIESVSEHDDIVMSTYMAIQYLRKGGQTFKAYMV